MKIKSFLINGLLLNWIYWIIYMSTFVIWKIFDDFIYETTFGIYANSSFENITRKYEQPLQLTGKSGIMSNSRYGRYVKILNPITVCFNPMDHSIWKFNDYGGCWWARESHMLRPTPLPPTYDHVTSPAPLDPTTLYMDIKQQVNSDYDWFVLCVQSSPCISDMRLHIAQRVCSIFIKICRSRL